MKIAADTHAELQEAIDAHAANGWVLVDKHYTSDGSYTATLARMNIINERKGDWITTFTGKQFYPLDPRADDICIEDIAHHLAMKPRYGGACRKFYTVAEHCWHLSYMSRDPLDALMHDASETYLQDLQRPIKPMVRGYAEIESSVMLVIAEKFGFSPYLSTELAELDHRIQADEARALLADSSWTNKIKPLGIVIFCWDWDMAERKFLERFKQLTA